MCTTDDPTNGIRLNHTAFFVTEHGYNLKVSGSVLRSHAHAQVTKLSDAPKTVRLELWSVDAANVQHDHPRIYFPVTAQLNESLIGCQIIRLQTD